ncbi:hypothetical protein ACOME3_007375 [Neoechinorhynchus agilis]
MFETPALDPPECLSTMGLALYEDIVIDDRPGLYNVFGEREFAPDAAGFMELVENEYDILARTDKACGQLISRSTHAYFATIMYWYRLKKIISSHGDYTDYRSVRCRLKIREPNANGQFRRADEATHSYYETFPAPAFLLKRVKREVELSRNRRGPLDDPNRDIQAVTPIWSGATLQREAVEEGKAQKDSEEEQESEVEVLGMSDAGGDVRENRSGHRRIVNPIRPTINLLGWRVAMRLRTSQLDALHYIFRDDEDPDIMNRTFQLRR